jgi:hypothetical protein
MDTLKWGTISNRNLIWMIWSNVRNEMMLHMQIRMLSIPLVSFENNVYRRKIHFWRLVKLIITFRVNMLKRYSTILVWRSIGKYKVFVAKVTFSLLEKYAQYGLAKLVAKYCTLSVNGQARRFWKPCNNILKSNRLITNKLRPHLYTR